MSIFLAWASVVLPLAARGVNESSGRFCGTVRGCRADLIVAGLGVPGVLFRREGVLASRCPSYAEVTRALSVVMGGGTRRGVYKWMLRAGRNPMYDTLYINSCLLLVCDRSRLVFRPAGFGLFVKNPPKFGGEPHDRPCRPRAPRSVWVGVGVGLGLSRRAKYKLTRRCCRSLCTKLLLCFNGTRAGRVLLYAAVAFMYRQAASEQYALVAGRWARGQRRGGQGQVRGDPPLPSLRPLLVSWRNNRGPKLLYWGIYAIHFAMMVLPLFWPQTPAITTCFDPRAPHNQQTMPSS